MRIYIPIIAYFFVFSLLFLLAIRSAIADGHIEFCEISGLAQMAGYLLRKDCDRRKEGAPRGRDDHREIG